MIDEAFPRPVVVLEFLVEIGLLEADAAVGIDAAAIRGMRRLGGALPDLLVIRLRPAVERGQRVHLNRAEIEFIEMPAFARRHAADARGARDTTSAPGARRSATTQPHTAGSTARRPARPSRGSIAARYSRRIAAP